jgi:hypothetical protein
MTLRTHIPLLFLTLLLSPAALPQTMPAEEATDTITLRLFDFETGQPMPDLEVAVYGNTGGKALPIRIEGDLYQVTVTGKATLKFASITATTPKTIEYSPCVLNTVNFDIKEIQTKGMSPPNNCSKLTHPAAPGELILFLRKAHWWSLWKDAH